jgi:uncharacterized protein YndB with AHSA1/START domain
MRGCAALTERKTIALSLEGPVAAEPERVWPFVAEPELLVRWFTFAKRFEVLEGEGLGRRQRIHGRWRDQDSEIDQVVTDFEPPRLIAWRHEAERLGGKPAPRFAKETRFAIELIPEGAATIVRLRGEQVPASYLRGLAIRHFGGRETLRQMDEALARLTILIEGSADPASR